jgi:hypothetical protein
MSKGDVTFGVLPSFNTRFCYGPIIISLGGEAGFLGEPGAEVLCPLSRTVY